MSTHSLKPWKLITNGQLFDVVDGTGSRVCISGGPGWPPVHVLKANAQLIVASPELLEAVIMVLDSAEGNPTFEDVFKKIDWDFLDRVRNKAEVQ